MQGKEEKKIFDEQISNSSSSAILKRQQTPAFLEKLFDILEDEGSYHHLISWQPDGNSFIIKKVNEFSEIVLPKYFKHSNIQSYIRQLNMYGFSKTRHDSNHHEFTHKLFQRGRRDLLPFIRRKTQNNPTGTAVPVKGSSPDFTALQVGTAGLKKAKNLFPAALLSSSNNCSSEASQSSNGMDEDMHEYSVHTGNLAFLSSPSALETTQPAQSLPATSPSAATGAGELEKRVQLLERQVIALTEFSLDLLGKHDQLCEALQNSLARGERSYSEEVLDHSEAEAEAEPEREADGAPQQERSEQDDGGPPLKRMKSMDGSSMHAPMNGLASDCEGTTTTSSSSSSSLQKRTRQTFCDLPPLPTQQRPVNFLEYLTSRSAKQLPTFTEESILRHIAPLASQPLALPMPGMKLERKSFSVDLGGLEAITAAAQFLLEDQQQRPSAKASAGRPPSSAPSPLRPAPTIEQSQAQRRRGVGWETGYGTMLLSRNSNATGPAPGSALTKSFSWGYDNKLS
jgi:hypothetical protein